MEESNNSQAEVQKNKRGKNINKSKNVYLKSLIALIILILFISLLSKSTNITEKILISYNTNSNIDYKVYLFSNDYIKDEYMGENQTYITSLVNNLVVDYNYEISTSDKFDSTYKYDIVADSVVKYNSTGEELWTDSIYLAQNQDVTITNGNQINIKNSVTVPYNEINSKVKSFKVTYNIPIKATLNVTLIITDTKTNKQIATTGLAMDLYEEVFEITKVSSGSDIQNVTETKQPNKIIVGIESFGAIISGIYLVYEIYTAITYTSSKKSFYSRALYKILKNYGDIVAELVRPVDLQNYKVIDVKNFDQMLDIEEELRIPIMFYELEKGVEGWFVLVHQDMAYRYILRDKFKR